MASDSCLIWASLTVAAPGLSLTNLTADLAANLPSVKEPDENLCGAAPTPSPAANKPCIVVILLYPQ